MTTPFEEDEAPYVDVYAEVEPYSAEYRLWARRSRHVAWTYAGLGIADGVVMPLLRPGVPWYCGAFAVLTAIAVLQRYCAKRRRCADQIMMDKFHEIFRAQLERHVV